MERIIGMTEGAISSVMIMIKKMEMPSGLQVEQLRQETEDSKSLD